MSDDTSSDPDSSDSEVQPIKFDEKVVIELTRQRIIDRNAKQSCKVLKLASKLDTEQKLAIINALEPWEYPKLFIFIIDDQHSDFMDAFGKFSDRRPLIIQHVSRGSKFYYKSEEATDFVDIDKHYVEDNMLYRKYKDDLNDLFDRGMEPLEDELLKKLSWTKESSVILRFLRTLDIQEVFYQLRILKVIETGSKSDLLAVLDATFVDDGRILSSQAQSYIRGLFQGSESARSTNEGSEDSSDEELDNPVDSTSQSVLLTAIQHSRQDIINYLITYCSHLIQQLPVEHQIKVATTAFNAQEYKVLCDLLIVSDFPFPQDFTFTRSKVNDELFRITKERMDFRTAIECEELHKLDDFIDRNRNSKKVYSINNNSALIEAIKARQFAVFYYLKSLGFEDESSQDALDALSRDDRKQAADKATKQRTENIQKSLKDCYKSVYNLCSKSLIHNRRISSEVEAEYRNTIRNWFQDIHVIAAEMLDVVASCEHLKIIFDFESQSVDSASFEGPDVSGITNKWIFIGAKFNDKAREQKIKGILAHELCHYVMSMVFENQELPYYKGDKQTEEMFKAVVARLDRWSTTKSEEPDDECNGIISTVYSLYHSQEFELELIVRAVHILAHFGDDRGKSDKLKDVYQDLFKFWYEHVVPEIQNYFKRDKAAIRVNDTVGLLSRTSKSNIEFSALDLKDLVDRGVELTVVVDCTGDKLTDIGKILTAQQFNFILVTSNEEQVNSLVKICHKKKAVPEVIDISYKWSDLTRESQSKLFETKVKFQSSNSGTTLRDIFTENPNFEGVRLKMDLRDFLGSIDTQLFNLLVEEQEISINSAAAVDDDWNAMKFELLFQQRKFLKKARFESPIPQEIFIKRDKNIGRSKYVLISDIAGSGKSWAMKNISRLIQKEDPTRWVSYVDLKQFIKEFKEQQFEADFASFFIEKLLKPKAGFEADIFRKLYKSGKVSIIFDGFDEIAPSCAEFVASLAKSFDSNLRNELWIVTRDYFEVNLQQMLNITEAYKLADFNQDEGINFIVASWILTDLKDPKSTKEFQSILQSSPNLAKYQKKATEIVRNVTMSKNQSIGLPQIFSMIADGFKKDKYIPGNLKRTKIFTKFVDKMYSRWADLRGKFRKKASVHSQHYHLGFMHFHQYCAISSTFPEYVDLFFPNYDESEWPEAEINVCGIMNRIRFFIHETFREFFIADFLFKNLKHPNIDQLLVQVLTVHKYGIIRMFLNDLIDSDSMLKDIQLKLEKSVEKFEEMENLSDFFTENQEHLAKLVVAILKTGSYDRV